MPLLQGSIAAAAAPRNEKSIFPQPHTLSLGSNGTASKRVYHRHNARTHSRHIETRQTSYTWPPGRHRGLAALRAVRSQPFLANSSCPGCCLSANYSLAHGEQCSPCANLSGIAWSCPQQEEFAKKANGVVCTSRRHQRVKVVESPARARDGWRCRQHR